MSEAFQLTIDGDLAGRLERAAASVGKARDAFARDLLDQHLFDYDAYTWRGDDPRTAPPLMQDARGTPWSQVEPELRQRLNERLSRRT